MSSIQLQYNCVKMYDVCRDGQGVSELEFFHMISTQNSFKIVISTIKNPYVKKNRAKNAFFYEKIYLEENRFCTGVFKEKAYIDRKSIPKHANTRETTFL